MNPIYAVEKIDESTWRVSENNGPNCYLLTGTKRALLVDSCWGVGNLRGVISELTDKPVTVAATHMHPDHVGGARQFGDCFVSPADLTAFNRLSCTRLAWKIMSKRVGVSGQRPESVKPTYLPLKNGQFFDLGEREIKAVSIPGHTPGSMMFVDRERKLIFTGDDVNHSTWLQVPGALSLEEWQTGARTVISYLEEGYTGWNGHVDGRLTLEMAKTVYGYVEEVIEKKRVGTLEKEDSPYPSKDAMPQLRFKTNNILRK